MKKSELLRLLEPYPDNYDVNILDVKSSQDGDNLGNGSTSGFYEIDFVESYNDELGHAEYLELAETLQQQPTPGIIIAFDSEK